MIFGGVGSGLYGMLVFAIIAVFIAGLMIGRTPEYLGKKIEAFEMKMASLVILVPPLLVLGGTAIAVMVDAGHAPASPTRARTASPRSCTPSPRPATTTAAPSPACRPTRRSTTRLLGIAMWLRPLLADRAGAGASPARWRRKKRVPASAGTLPTHTPLFVVLLVGTVLLVGALTFVPALALGPVVEHLQMMRS